MTTDAFPCPHCSTSLEPGLPACPSCGLRLVGLDAARLWQVRQQIEGLEAESARLVERLLAPAPSYQPAHAPGPLPAGVRRSSPTGQQLLLGLGALLLLSAASFFLLVVWLVVGLVGQALIMAALTATASAGAVVATRRGLPAAAETAAVIATGLVVLDLAAAHGLGLAGLDRVATDSYWSVAGLLGAGLLVGFDALVPRGGPDARLRRVVVYRPAAAVLFAVALWSMAAALDPTVVVLSALTLLLAAVSGASAWVAYHLDADDRTASTGGLELPWSTLPLIGSALVGLLVHLLSGLAVGYDPASSTGERYAALVLLLVGPAALALLARRVGRPRLHAATVLWSLPGLGVALVDAPAAVVALVAVLLAALVAVEHAGRLPLRAAPWLDTASVVAWVAQPAFFLLLLSLADEGVDTPRELLEGMPGTGIAVPAEPGSLLWWLPVVAAAAWAVSSLVGVLAAARDRAATGGSTGTAWAVVAQLAALVTLFAAFRDSGSTAWAVAMVLAAGVTLGLAGVARSRWPEVEASLVVFAAVHGLIATMASLDRTIGDTSDRQLAAVLVALGVITLGYAAVPGRLVAAYVGSLLVSAGTGVLLDDARVEAVEAYTAPLVLLLAAVGLVQWSRDRGAPTRLTMGPALSVGLLPSAWSAIEDGGTLRLALVTAAAVLVLVVGLAQHWQAPVAVGAVVLVLVAVTQGGPFMEYVPGWVTLGAAGAALLAAGVAWESAVQAGRRTTAWFGALR